MSMIPHRPGTFSWLDLAAHDRAAAERFYTALFGWTARADQFGPHEDDVYVMLRKDGRDAAALYAMDAAQKSLCVPPAWLCYVTVASADAAAARARELGASLMADAFDVMELGRMALITDPGGAVLALWEPRSHAGAGITGEPGSLCWTELSTRDTAAASRFYAGLFGWESRPADDPSRTVFTNGGEPAASMAALPGDAEGGPSYWLPWFAVDDVDASAARARELGATVEAGPRDVPGMGRIARIRDPQGAPFGIMRRA